MYRELVDKTNENTPFERLVRRTILIKIGAGCIIEVVK